MGIVRVDQYGILLYAVALMDCESWFPPPPNVL